MFIRFFMVKSFPNMDSFTVLDHNNLSKSKKSMVKQRDTSLIITVNWGWMGLRNLKGNFEEFWLKFQPCYAEFTLHDFNSDIHLLTGFAKSLTNGQNLRQIGARSREWQSHSMIYQRQDLRESLTRRRCPRNIWHAKYLDLSAIQNPAVWNEFWLKNILAMTYSQWESKIQAASRSRRSYMQSRSSLYAEYASCVGPPKHLGAPLLSNMF